MTDLTIIIPESPELERDNLITSFVESRMDALGTDAQMDHNKAVEIISAALSSKENIPCDITPDEFCDTWEELKEIRESEKHSKHNEEDITMKITFTADGTCNIMISEDGAMYAETTLPEDVTTEYGEKVSPVDEDYGYMALKAAILDLAAAHGIAADTLSFTYDGQEQYLSDDARADVTVRADWRG